MPELREILPDRIRERLEITGKSMRALSLEIGAHAGYVRDLFDPERFTVPSSLRMQSLANALGTTTEFLLGEAADPHPVRSEVGVSDKHVEWLGPERGEPGIPLLGTGDCADLAVIETETHQTVHVERSSFDPDYHVRMISRPPALRGARDIYAIYFHGSSMEPRFEAGEVGLVDPRRPPRAGEYVLVQLNSGESDEVTTVLAKRLVRQNAQELVLEQFNPPLVFAVPRSRIARVHRILPQTDLLFG